jgi:HAD superfamily hydrolase (TIGR01549 family)
MSPDENFMELFGDRWQEGKSRFYEILRDPSSISALKTLPGSVEMLDAIQAMGIPMAVISNKKSMILNVEIRYLGWADYFFAVVGSGDAAFDKPRPDPLLYALRIGEMTPGEHVWMVGDMHSDIEAACLAGVTPILIETTSSLGLGLEGKFDTHKPRSRVSDALAFLELVKRERDTISIAE